MTEEWNIPMESGLDIPAVLARLKPYNLSPIERVLAAHTGTVQLLLSLYFGSPVDVTLVEQSEEVGEIRRRASLVVSGTGQEACFARSVIPLSANNREVLAGVREGKLGLGQVAVKHRIPTERRIREITVTPRQICRKYIMQGPGLYYAVTEVFPRDFYRAESQRTPLKPDRWAQAVRVGV